MQGETLGKRRGLCTREPETKEPLQARMIYLSETPA
jgi:hypothetical protein